MFILNLCISSYPSYNSQHLQGLKLVKILQTQNLIVVGDSENIIRHMVLGTNPLDSRLAFVFERIRQAIIPISNVNFYHVLRENNSIADQFTNKATLGKEGDIVINGKAYHQPIP